MPEEKLSRLYSGAGTVFVVTALIFTATGCGSNPESAPVPTASPPPAPTQPPQPTPAPGYDPVMRNADWEPVTQIFDGVEMALVPAGCFQMGSPDAQIDYALELFGAGGSREWFAEEQPAHEVCFEAPFWIDVYEVTNGAFGSSGEWDGEDLPRESVSWNDAAAHCESRGARLPTEAEWEYAARGPDGLIFPWGDAFAGEMLSFCDTNCGNVWADDAIDDGEPFTAPVGSFPGGVSWVGAYDLSGNVWEWVNDAYASNTYSTLPDSVVNPQGPADSTGTRMLRGGSWFDNAAHVRPAIRIGYRPDYTSRSFGFRCALSYQP